GPGSTTGTYAACVSAQTYANLADGSYTFSVRATDTAGNTDASPATRSFTVDTTAPAAPVITAPPDNTLQNTATVTVSGTAEANATIALFDAATQVGSTTATGGAWSITLSNFTDATHTYT